MNLTETGMSTSALAPAAQDEIATLFVDAAGYRRHRHPYRPSARRAAASPVAASRTARSPHSIAADNFSFVRELILLGQGVGLLPASLCEADIAAGAVAAVLPSSSPERPDPPLRDREPQTLRWRRESAANPILPRGLDAANRSSSSLARPTGVPSFAMAASVAIARRQLRRAPP